MTWEGGGGSCAAAVAYGAAAIAAGYSRYVVVFRSIAQPEGARFGQAKPTPSVSGQMAYSAPYGVFSAAQIIAPRVRRFMHDHHVSQDALRAVSMVSYHHAQTNPRAVMYGRPLSEHDYDHSRWITEPFHLYDCCQENDGAAAIILTSAERAVDGPHPPVALMGAAQGFDPTYQLFSPHEAPSAGRTSTRWHLASGRCTGLEPSDVDVLQAYENFSGATLMAITEHGFCAPDEINDFFKVEHLTSPSGRLPMNTSGGNLAEAYIHGMELIVEAVRQLWGTSRNQVPGPEVSAVIGGPVTTPVSDLVFARMR